jgi:glycosyltransferase involved in cell wall biosynthesis
MDTITMPELSVIIPNRNSPFTAKTILDILEKTAGKVEVIVNVDENWPDPIVDDKRVTYIHPGAPKGMRWGINAAVALAKGKYIMKTDDHCMFASGFDNVLIENHKEDNWVQIPRRYSLDADNWKVNEGRPFRDYHYLCFPAKGKAHDEGMHGVEWWSRQKERSAPKYDIDDTPSMQGSCWFMTKNHFDNFLHGLSEEGYGSFAQESQEIGLKTWLSGGALKVNKKTWYAHLFKGKHYGKMYHLNREEDHGQVEGANWSARHWMNSEEYGMIHNIEWFVTEKFPNMPSWEPNWKEIWASYQR